MNRIVSARRRGVAGALLLVLLIALVIIGILYFAGPGGGYAKQAVVAKKRVETMGKSITTDQLTKMILMYRDANRKLPKTPSDVEDPPGPYWNDPWGKQMTFTFEEPRGSGPVKVTYISAGPDGVFGNEDDVKKTEALPF